MSGFRRFKAVHFIVKEGTSYGVQSYSGHFLNLTNCGTVWKIIIIILQQFPWSYGFLSLVGWFRNVLVNDKAIPRTSAKTDV